MKRGLTGRYEIISVAGERIRAFVPHSLPPNPPLDLGDTRQLVLERALLALGRLDSISTLLPDPHLFLYSYVRREAVVSSQQRLVKLFKDDANCIQERGRATATVLRVYDVLRERPAITLNDGCRRTGMSFPTATKGINALLELSIARELTGQRRNRVFVYDRYLSILSEGTEPL